MTVDFQKLQTDVSDIREMLLALTTQNPKQTTVAPADEVLDYSQAAELLGLTIQTLYGKVSNREIPFTKVRRRTYFSRQDLFAWLRSQRTETTQEKAAQYEQGRAKRSRRTFKQALA